MERHPENFMKKIIKIPLIAVGILILVTILMASFNICPPQGPWPSPPWCQGAAEKKHAIPEGTPTTATFWVSIPYNTPKDDIVILSINEKEQVSMRRINEVSWEASVPVKGGDRLYYKYLRNSQNSFSDPESIVIKRADQKIFDSVSMWNDLQPRTNLSQDFKFNMLARDTWGPNYNGNWFENTRNNVDSTFKRLKALDVKVVGVTSFANFLEKDDSFVLEEITNPYKYFRDITMTQEDMEQIAKTAHKNGMQVVLLVNVYEDITKLMKPGINIGEERAKLHKKLGIDEPKTKDWIDQWYDEWEKILALHAERAQKAGIEMLVITPQDISPNFSPLEDYALNKQNEMIDRLRNQFKIKIVSFWSKDNADILFYNPGTVDVSKDPSLSEIKAAHKLRLDDAEKELSRAGKDVFLFVYMASYDGASKLGGLESYDTVGIEAKGLVQDWQEQADYYEALFEALNERNNSFFKGVYVWGYWWDDAMDPEDTTFVRITLDASIRNKPAEAVFRKWAQLT